MAWWRNFMLLAICYVSFVSVTAAPKGVSSSNDYTRSGSSSSSSFSSSSSSGRLSGIKSATKTQAVASSHQTNANTFETRIDRNSIDAGAIGTSIGHQNNAAGNAGYEDGESVFGGILPVSDDTGKPNIENGLFRQVIQGDSYSIDSHSQVFSSHEESAVCQGDDCSYDVSVNGQKIPSSDNEGQPIQEVKQDFRSQTTSITSSNNLQRPYQQVSNGPHGNAFQNEAFEVPSQLDTASHTDSGSQDITQDRHVSPVEPVINDFQFIGDNDDHHHDHRSGNPIDWLREGIPGEPGTDYPIFYQIPTTSFECTQQEYPAGIYGDMETQCQAFHICQRSGRHDSFLCPNGTVFNQKYFVCDWWYNYECADTPGFYSLNADIYQEVDESSFSRVINGMVNDGFVSADRRVSDGQSVSRQRDNTFSDIAETKPPINSRQDSNEPKISTFTINNPLTGTQADRHLDTSRNDKPFAVQEIFADSIPAQRDTTKDYYGNNVEQKQDTYPINDKLEATTNQQPDEERFNAHQDDNGQLSVPTEESTTAGKSQTRKINRNRSRPKDVMRLTVAKDNSAQNLRQQQEPVGRVTSSQYGQRRNQGAVPETNQQGYIQVMIDDRNIPYDQGPSIARQPQTNEKSSHHNDFSQNSSGSNGRRQTGGLSRFDTQRVQSDSRGIQQKDFSQRLVDNGIPLNLEVTMDTQSEDTEGPFNSFLSTTSESGPVTQDEELNVFFQDDQQDLVSTPVIDQQLIDDNFSTAVSDEEVSQQSISTLDSTGQNEEITKQAQIDDDLQTFSDFPKTTSESGSVTQDDRFQFDQNNQNQDQVTSDGINDQDHFQQTIDDQISFDGNQEATRQSQIDEETGTPTVFSSSSAKTDLLDQNNEQVGQELINIDDDDIFKRPEPASPSSSNSKAISNIQPGNRAIISTSPEFGQRKDKNSKNDARKQDPKPSPQQQDSDTYFQQNLQNRRVKTRTNSQTNFNTKATTIPLQDKQEATEEGTDSSSTTDDQFTTDSELGTFAPFPGQTTPVEFTEQTDYQTTDNENIEPSSTLTTDNENTEFGSTFATNNENTEFGSTFTTNNENTEFSSTFTTDDKLNGFTGSEQTSDITQKDFLEQKTDDSLFLQNEAEQKTTENGSPGEDQSQFFADGQKTTINQEQSRADAFAGTRLFDCDRTVTEAPNTFTEPSQGSFSDQPNYVQQKVDDGNFQTPNFVQQTQISGIDAGNFNRPVQTLVPFPSTPENQASFRPSFQGRRFISNRVPNNKPENQAPTRDQNQNNYVPQQPNLQNNRNNQYPQQQEVHEDFRQNGNNIPNRNAITDPRGLMGIIIQNAQNQELGNNGVQVGPRPTMLLIRPQAIDYSRGNVKVHPLKQVNPQVHPNQNIGQELQNGIPPWQRNQGRGNNNHQQTFNDQQQKPYDQQGNQGIRQPYNQERRRPDYPPNINPQPHNGRPDYPPNGNFQPDNDRPDFPINGKPQPHNGRPDYPPNGNFQPDNDRPDFPINGKPQPNNGKPDLPSNGKFQPDNGRPDFPTNGKPQPDNGRPDFPTNGRPQPDIDPRFFSPGNQNSPLVQNNPNIQPARLPHVNIQPFQPIINQFSLDLNKNNGDFRANQNDNSFQTQNQNGPTIQNSNNFHEQRIFNDQRNIDEQRIFDDQRNIDEQRIFDDQRNIDEQRIFDDQRNIDEQRIFDDQRNVDEQVGNFDNNPRQFQNNVASNFDSHDSYLQQATSTSEVPDMRSWGGADSWKPVIKHSQGTYQKQPNGQYIKV